MRARDVIVIARRRANLTQRELAGRLGVTQRTISRWESGVTEPKFCVVQKASVACGFDLTLGFANADGGSWNSLIFEQLRLSPAARVHQFARGHFDRVEALKAFSSTGVRAIVVGETAGAPLRLTERLRSEPPRPPRKLSEQEAREAADKWLEQQTPVGSTMRR